MTEEKHQDDILNPVRGYLLLSDSTGPFPEEKTLPPFFLLFLLSK
jgi:hypothetical protein